MKCLFCQEELKRGSAPYHIDRSGYHLQFDSIPAWICPQCGEPYFEEKEVDGIQNTIRVLDEHAMRVMTIV